MSNDKGWTNIEEVEFCSTERAEQIAAKVWSGSSMMFGGHSQVPLECYGDAIVGNINNNTHWSNRGREEVLHVLKMVATQVEKLVDAQWGDCENYAEILTAFQKGCEENFTTFLENELARGMLVP